MSQIDPNVWYLVTEGRVDTEGENFNSCLQDANGEGDLMVNARVDQHWQFQPVEGGPSGRYHLRTDRKGADEQLSACFQAEEVHPLKTGICMQPSSLSEAQQWDLVRWAEDNELGGFKFINVANGTDLWLDVHPGNPPFMSNNIDESIIQPAQHWFLQSAKEVNDGAFSTVYDIPASTAVSNEFPTDASSSQRPDETGGNDETDGGDAGDDGESNTGSGLSAGAAAGIGVGVGLAVLLIGIAVFVLLKRQRKAKMWSKEEQALQGANIHGGFSDVEGHAYPAQTPKTYASPVYSATPPTEADEGKPASIHEAPQTGRRIELP